MPGPSDFHGNHKKNSFSCRTRKIFIWPFLPPLRLPRSRHARICLGCRVPRTPKFNRVVLRKTESCCCLMQTAYSETCCIGIPFLLPLVVLCVLVANECGKRKRWKNDGWCGQACAKSGAASNYKKVHKKLTAPSSHARWLHKNQPEGCITAVIHWTQACKPMILQRTHGRVAAEPFDCKVVIFGNYHWRFYTMVALLLHSISPGQSLAVMEGRY